MLIRPFLLLKWLQVRFYSLMLPRRYTDVFFKCGYVFAGMRGLESPALLLPS
ncbi:hypothetical protein BJY04DRAFT_187979 [Aspergillus karnatakaensis]|uniref:uncharacterized protein n=1 Tax=Aspergillus karnatakaensis TaxID=1810916 RepID=UPI003CCD1B69